MWEEVEACKAGGEGAKTNEQKLVYHYMSMLFLGEGVPPHVLPLDTPLHYIKLLLAKMLFFSFVVRQ